ncbi:D-alanyl-D-alanine carboxypeptidase/D-alanyl-D-alanine endopeptidase [Oceanobacillus salinisoli]|uniref:D-alanyl-D-alanine carboxypeptidase/D-alanyl-D-alanine endopeptidase n=1 Tax=Oceanobacillus salinisoli TaxID=2678611 RepID=UPI0012E30470|nr:D-alanyl-D-alanine carboxypeptidase/D-alanyl-D-alanine-endopeptidase [Oceanobacillus salinisoli]
MKEKILEYIHKDPKLKGALIGISIRSPQTGDLLFEHQADIRMHPASNMKLLTGAAALSVLGEDYTFLTELKTDGEIRGNVLDGNLYLVGKGDPTLLPEVFDGFALELKNQGIETIKGDIIGDDTWYDDMRLSPDLVWTDEQYYYGSQVSALTASPNEDYDTGAIILEITPGEHAGDKPEIKVFPDINYVTIENQAITVNKQVEEELMVEREHATNQISISGKITADSEKQKEVMAVWDASNYAMKLFQNGLEKAGITWRGDIRLGCAPENLHSLLSRNSMPLSDLLVPFMKQSNNGHAEILVKEMGKVMYEEGSWEKGLDVVKKQIQRFGLCVDTLVLKDGSGISHSDAIPPNEITKLLYEVQNEAWFPVFLNSLPIAGEGEQMVGGTLNDRLKGYDVKAKTGTIEGVSTLSGYLTTKQGKRLIFSIMVNHLLDEEEGKQVEDEIIEIIVGEYEKTL